MLYPVPAVLVGCRDENGKDNLMTAAWAGTICSDPVMVSVSIRKERYSHDIIEQTGEFQRHEAYAAGVLEDQRAGSGRKSCRTGMQSQSDPQAGES